ncbi:hypothetical protein T439DRAFT_326047 [Meredithblackwellia eburnea MCA 4105]
MHSLTTRRSTFKPASSRHALKWPFPLKSPLNPDVLAVSGFSHLGGLATTCYSCDAVVTGWKAGDSVDERHLEAQGGRWCASRIFAQVKTRRDEGEREWEDVEWSELEEVRRDSFRVGWPHEGVKGVPTAKEIADAGWFFRPGSEGGGDDTCVCPFCTRTVEGWEEGDVPKDLHNRKAGLNCPFFLNQSKKSSSTVKKPTSTRSTTSNSNAGTGKKKTNNRRSTVTASKPESSQSLSLTAIGEHPSSAGLASNFGDELIYDNDVEEDEEEEEPQPRRTTRSRSSSVEPAPLASTSSSNSRSSRKSRSSTASSTSNTGTTRSRSTRNVRQSTASTAPTIVEEEEEEEEERVDDGQGVPESEIEDVVAPPTKKGAKGKGRAKSTAGARAPSLAPTLSITQEADETETAEETEEVKPKKKATKTAKNKGKKTVPLAEESEVEDGFMDREREDKDVRPPPSSKKVAPKSSSSSKSKAPSSSRSTAPSQVDVETDVAPVSAPAPTSAASTKSKSSSKKKKSTIVPVVEPELEMPFIDLQDEEPEPPSEAETVGKSTSKSLSSKKPKSGSTKKGKGKGRVGTGKKGKKIASGGATNGGEETESELGESELDRDTEAEAETDLETDLETDIEGLDAKDGAVMATGHPQELIPTLEDVIEEEEPEEEEELVLAAVHRTAPSVVEVPKVKAKSSKTAAKGKTKKAVVEVDVGPVSRQKQLKTNGADEEEEIEEEDDIPRRRVGRQSPLIFSDDEMQGTTDEPLESAATRSKPQQVQPGLVPTVVSPSASASANGRPIKSLPSTTSLARSREISISSSKLAPPSNSIGKSPLGSPSSTPRIAPLEPRTPTDPSLKENVIPSTFSDGANSTLSISQPYVAPLNPFDPSLFPLLPPTAAELEMTVADYYQQAGRAIVDKLRQEMEKETENLKQRMELGERELLARVEEARRRDGVMKSARKKKGGMTPGRAGGAKVLATR